MSRIASSAIRRRLGVTPLEVLVVVVVASLVLATAVPAARSALDAVAVAGEARRIASAHLRARFTAIMESRTALFTVRADSLIIRVVVGTDTTVRWADRGPEAQNIALSGPDRAMRFSPVGIMAGVTNGTWRLTRGAAERNVVVSRLGRVRVVKP
jgi:Tfp pilus assembly protein FimT